ncbi:uracil-DNA glycosylase [Aurantiacibacter gangjinensis]|uniref:Uracil-DNA glycosylase n=1 Tax=Aurantiacibacter gangjinensis TaxID=502682 RepID=A0A0G9ML07_9SPHN|nr:uracil-DNA glycosylase [Aurantiacibacter gangjinensis]KLE31416.1 uracil-DNA glycosylase [Aurantiacibacter gangjinensis]
MIETIPASWAPVLEPVLATPQARKLASWLDAEEAAGKRIYPAEADRLRALELTAPQDVRAVVLGQDPYHGEGQAHGLAFSVPYGQKLPPSLRNIAKELQSDLGMAPPLHGNLESWARQGVLLLNNTLTVEEGKAGSHTGKGWDAITGACIAEVARADTPTVFILWGAHAQAKAARIAELGDTDRHLLIASPHPSPLSAHRGFFGSRPFSQANAFLESAGRGSVDWRI